MYTIPTMVERTSLSIPFLLRPSELSKYVDTIDGSTVLPNYALKLVVESVTIMGKTPTLRASTTCSNGRCIALCASSLNFLANLWNCTPGNHEGKYLTAVLHQGRVPVSINELMQLYLRGGTTSTKKAPGTAMCFTPACSSSNRRMNLLSDVPALIP
jgi:hypothetical protein